MALFDDLLLHYVIVLWSWKKKQKQRVTPVAGITYGIYKQDLDEKVPRHVAMTDIGYTHTEVSVIAFTKGHLKVRNVVLKSGFLPPAILSTFHHKL